MIILGQPNNPGQLAYHEILNLITFARSLLLYVVTHSQIPGTRTWMYLGAVIQRGAILQLKKHRPNFHRVSSIGPESFILYQRLWNGVTRNKYDIV